MTRAGVGLAPLLNLQIAYGRRRNTNFTSKFSVLSRFPFTSAPFILSYPARVLSHQTINNIVAVKNASFPKAPARQVTEPPARILTWPQPAPVWRSPGRQWTSPDQPSPANGRPTSVGKQTDVMVKENKGQLLMNGQYAILISQADGAILYACGNATETDRQCRVY